MSHRHRYSEHASGSEQRRCCALGARARRQALPLLDEPLPPSLGRYGREHTKRRGARIGSFDGYLFVTPEYSHGVSAALKNAVDYLFADWNRKATVFVSSGDPDGARAVEQLRLVFAELMVADTCAQVLRSLFTDFEKSSVFRPDPRHEAELNAMLDLVIAWARALKSPRSKARAEVT